MVACMKGVWVVHRSIHQTWLDHNIEQTNPQLTSLHICSKIHSLVDSTFHMMYVQGRYLRYVTLDRSSRTRSLQCTHF